MRALGVAELIVIGFFAVPPFIAVVCVWVWLFLRSKRLGYGSTREYLRAAPRSDAEKRDAAHITMVGLVYCMLGLILPAIVLPGLIPLFYGGRKLAYASMGLGLVDDGAPQV